MTKTQQLIIRACKSKNPQRRLRSVYRRFYGRFDYDIESRYLSIVVCDVVDDYIKPSTFDVITGVSGWDFIPKLNAFDHNQKVLQYLMDLIRFSEESKFPGLTKAAKFRN